MFAKNKAIKKVRKGLNSRTNRINSGAGGESRTLVSSLENLSINRYTTPAQQNYFSKLRGKSQIFLAFITKLAGFEGRLAALGDLAHFQGLRNF